MSLPLLGWQQPVSLLIKLKQSSNMAMKCRLHLPKTSSSTALFASIHFQPPSKTMEAAARVTSTRSFCSLVAAVGNPPSGSPNKHSHPFCRILHHLWFERQQHFQHHPHQISFTSTTTTSTATSRFYSTTVPDLWKVAIVGSGPSGCYTAKYLQQALKKMKDKTDTTTASVSSTIDIFERLPTAYGLVRNGVAPDHPEVKNVQNDFDELFLLLNDSDSTNSTIIQFYGNVHVGKDVSLQELRQRYDIVVLAFGCESDRTLNIPGNQLQHILTARQFVNWYNGHPDFEWVGSIVQEALSKSTDKSSNSSNIQSIVVIGHGNVALDCARILAKTRDELNATDLTTRALDILHPTPTSSSNQQQQQPQPRHRNISIVGRRGHVQGAFTIKEVRELTKLPNAEFVVRKDELDAGGATDASQEELKGSRPRQRIDKLLRDHATSHDSDDHTSTKSSSASSHDQVHLRFLLNPVRFENDHDDSDTLGAVVCERTQLQGEAGKQSAVGTGEEETIPADLCLVSIGYKGIPIEGTEEFYDDARGILKNYQGVVHKSKIEDSNHLASLYVSGWLKRGPSGIIGTNIADAKDTVASIVSDLQQQQDDRELKDKPPTTSLRELLEERGVQVVDWASYQRINEEETSPERLRSPEQPREKLTEWKDLLEAAKE